MPGHTYILLQLLFPYPITIENYLSTVILIISGQFHFAINIQCCARFHGTDSGLSYLEIDGTDYNYTNNINKLIILNKGAIPVEINTTFIRDIASSVDFNAVLEIAEMTSRGV